MTPIKTLLSDPWRSGDDANIILGGVKLLRPPTMLRCTVLGAEPVCRIPVELERLVFLAHGTTGSNRRYGFYSYDRDGWHTLQRLLIILETYDDQANGFVLPESVMDTFATFARYLSPSQLWAIGFTISVARNDQSSQRGTGGTHGRFGLGEYD